MASRLVLAFRAAWDVLRSSRRPPASPPPADAVLPRFLARSLRRLCDQLFPVPPPDVVPYETRLRAATVAGQPITGAQLRTALAAEALHRAAFERVVHTLGPEVTVAPPSRPTAVVTALDETARERLAASLARAVEDGIDLPVALGRTRAEVEKLLKGHVVPPAPRM